MCTAPRIFLAPPVDTTARVAWRRLLALSGLYFGVRAAGVGLLVAMQLLNGRRPTLQAWDADWYTAIARYGYAGVPTSMTDAFGHHSPDSAMVFFPGYPQLVRLVAGLGVGITAGAVVVSVLAGL